jgi:c-di-GMP-specific phosphodiesterase
VAGRDGSPLLAEQQVEMLGTALAHTDRVVLLVGADRRIVYANDALTDMLGFSREEALGRLPSELLSSPHWAPGMVDRWRRSGWGRAAFEDEILAGTKDGRDLWLRAWVDPVFDGEELTHLVILLSDVTQERQLRDLQRDVLAALTSEMGFQRLGDYVCERIQAMVPGVIASVTEVVDGRLRPWAGPGLPAAYAEALDGVEVGEGVASCGTSAFRGEPVMVYDIATDPLWASCKDQVLPLGLRSCWSFPVISRGDVVVGTFAFYFREPTRPDPQLERLARACVDLCSLALEREDARRRLARVQQLDALTGLPNRLHLRELLDAMIVAETGRDGVLLYLLDIDRFRTVVDALGHDAGDRALVQIGNRLRHVVGSLGVVGRMGADVFGVVTPTDDPLSGASMAERLRAAVAEPLVVEGQELALTASIGAGHHPAISPDADGLMAGVEAALASAKAEGGDTYRFVTPQLNQYAQDRRDLATALRIAVTTGVGLQLHYQPQMRVSDQSLAGVEALLRWHDPVRGDVSPARFIGLAEELGLIDAVGRWALAEACRQLAAWQEAGMGVPRVSVNLAAGSLRSPTLPGYVAGLLEEHGIPGSMLAIEVTESMMLDLTAETRAVMEGLRTLGVGIAVDDFGTGFSSLTTLVSLPITEIKIDQSFVRVAPEDEKVGALVEAILGIGASLGLGIVAEGVETPAQREFLLGHGSVAIQGYLVSRPLPAEETTAWLRTVARIAP